LKIKSFKFFNLERNRRS